MGNLEVGDKIQVNQDIEYPSSVESEIVYKGSRGDIIGAVEWNGIIIVIGSGLKGYRTVKFKDYNGYYSVHEDWMELECIKMEVGEEIWDI